MGGSGGVGGLGEGGAGVGGVGEGGAGVGGVGGLGEGGSSIDESESDESESNESESNGLNNKMSGLAANCYDINKPVTLNDQYTKNIACKNVPPPANNRMRVNYYNSGGVNSRLAYPHTPM